MAGKVALLLWAQTLGLAGAQTTQLLVEPPWTPAVLWDWVRLTCQGLGTASATTWYRDGQWWWKKGLERITVSKSGNYTCDRPGSGRSDSVTGPLCPPDWLVLQVPAWPLLEGDTVTLHCRGSKDKSITSVLLYHKKEELWGLRDGPELSLSPLKLHHKGHYRCSGKVDYWWQEELVPVTVTVHGVPPSGVSLSAQPPGGQVAPGDRLVLSCAVATGTGPLSFTWHRGSSGAPLGTGRHLELWDTGDNDSGHYHYLVSNRDSVAKSVPLNVTVLAEVPVANATITLGPLSHQVHTGDPVTLRCSVQVGSAPVTFTWLHNGQEVARGPSLELGFVTMRHSGTYQCVATNQLGQDGHRVFWALSPKLALEVTPQGHLNTAVATGVGGSLHFLVLLVGGVVGWRRWNHMAARKYQERVPLDPPAPPEEGEVLYTHVMSTKQMGGEYRRPPVPPHSRIPRVTYVELRGPRGRLRELSDIHGNVL
ncbi:Fc receptor-like protein 1 [Prinia subflava]|uniref:Fc receptor-like protein 1 n=1 Tax=Prinia subflava TaxID=208062 RepID=UPI002FE29AA8